MGTIGPGGDAPIISAVVEPVPKEQDESLHDQSAEFISLPHQYQDVAGRQETSGEPGASHEEDDDDEEDDGKDGGGMKLCCWIIFQLS